MYPIPNDVTVTKRFFGEAKTQESWEHIQSRLTNRQPLQSSKKRQDDNHTRRLSTVKVEKADLSKTKYTIRRNAAIMHGVNASVRGTRYEHRIIHDRPEQMKIFFGKICL